MFDQWHMYQNGRGWITLAYQIENHLGLKFVRWDPSEHTKLCPQHSQGCIEDPDMKCMGNLLNLLGRACPFQDFPFSHIVEYIMGEANWGDRHIKGNSLSQNLQMELSDLSSHQLTCCKTFSGCEAMKITTICVIVVHKLYGAKLHPQSTS